ncbi:11552_t:CDS:2 [Rhizophagus irregularis]|nr:11552_t:CDS:2 [Rhizophagus irregularis]
MAEIITTDNQINLEGFNRDDNLEEIQSTESTESSSINEVNKGKQKEVISISTEDIKSTSTKEVKINSDGENEEINDLIQSDIVEVRYAGLNDIDIRNYLQFTAAMIMGVSLKELDDHTTSLMKLGMDSNTLKLFLKRIADILPSFIELPDNFIEDNLSIDLITQFILDIMSGGGENSYNKKKQKLPNELEEDQEKLQCLVEDLVDKHTLYIKENYTQQSTESSDTQQSSDTSIKVGLKELFIEQKVFLLTGATRFLGAHILNILLCHSDSIIYCLVKRKKAQSPKASLKRAFLRYGFDSSLIDSKQLIALSSNLSEPYLGTANLLLFSAQKEFHFISSLDCCLNGPWEKVPEGIIPLKASITTGDGYGLTNLILETILINTFDYLQLESVSIIRTSQLTCNSKSGVWSPNDMIPLLLRNAGITGRIPVFEEKLDWIPVDIAAKSIVDLVITENRLSRVEVFHVSNPNSTITWKNYLDILEESAGMKFQRIELEQWLEKLEGGVTDGIYDEGNFMILNEYFKRYLNNTSTVRAMLDIVNTKSRTYILSKCPPLNEELVTLNIDWLRNTGNLSEIASPPTTTTEITSKKMTISDSSDSIDANEKQEVYGIYYIIVSKSFFEVSIIAGWIATVIFVDDNNQQQNVADASEELLNDIDRIEREFRNHKRNSVNGKRRIVFRKRVSRNIE